MRSLIRSGMERASPHGPPRTSPEPTLPDAPAAPVLHTGLFHEGSTKDDQPRKPPLGFFLAAVHTASPGSALSPASRARRRLVQPSHTPHTLQVWLRTSAERHETERQKRARFLAQCSRDTTSSRAGSSCGRSSSVTILTSWTPEGSRARTGRISSMSSSNNLPTDGAYAFALRGRLAR